MRVGDFPEENSLIKTMDYEKRSAIGKMLASMTTNTDALNALEHILINLLKEPILKLTPNADDGYIAASVRDIMKACASKAGDYQIVEAIDKMIADRNAGLPTQAAPQQAAGNIPNPTSLALLENQPKGKS